MLPGRPFARFCGLVLGLIFVLSNTQSTPAAVSSPHRDPQGRGAAEAAVAPMEGVSISCTDIRTGSPFDYRAQHLLASGQLDPDWSPNDARLCLGASDGLHQLLCPDGTGGAFAGWVDTRVEDGDIYLQHFTASGALASGWPVDGLPVCRARYSQYQLDLAPDAAGGALLAWVDFRSGGAGRIYVQHVHGDGSTAEGWPVDGLAVCALASDQSAPRILATSDGGAWLVWQDRRDGSLDLYAQRLTATGTVAGGWPEHGTRLTSAAGDEVGPQVVADGAGHLTLLWRELGSGSVTLRALALSEDAVPTEGVAAEALALSSAAGDIGASSVVRTADGGANVAWLEHRQEGPSLRLQRLTVSGAAAGGWPEGGLLLAVTASAGAAPALLAQPDSGVVVAWEDVRGEGDIYAQRISASGLVAPGWPDSGVAVCRAPQRQFAPSLVSDGAAGALVSWADASSEAQATMFSLQSMTATVATLTEATARPGHAHVTWRITDGLVGSLQAYRRIGTDSPWTLLAACAPDDSNRVIVDDRTVPDGVHVEYRLVLVGEDAERYLEPVALDIPVAPLRLALHRAWPLAAQNTVMLAFALPRGDAPAVDLIDVQGRRMARRVFEGLEPGEQTLRWSVPRHLASGVYFLRLTQGAEAQSAKLVFVR